jgi:hypothetical protein
MGSSLADGFCFSQNGTEINSIAVIAMETLIKSSIFNQRDHMDCGFDSTVNFARLFSLPVAGKKCLKSTNSTLFWPEEEVYSIFVTADYRNACQ